MNDLGAPTYLDTSALAKLLWEEPESDTLRASIEGSDTVLTASELVEIELMRAMNRRSDSNSDLVRRLLKKLVILPLTESMKSRAQVLGPPTIRSLDAIHLATALEIAPLLAALVTYDQRMIKAGRNLGLPVSSPGMAG